MNTPGYLADAMVVSALRRSGYAVRDYVGSSDVVISEIVADEIFFGIEPEHPIYQGNLRVLAQMGATIGNEPLIVFTGFDLVQRYARHHKPLAQHDALIAAAAIRQERILLTKNTRDFHYIERLAYIDLNLFDPRQGSIIEQCPVSFGAISKSPCCRHLTVR